MQIDASVPLVAAGLIGGFAAARYSGKRPLGGVVLAAAGAAAGRRWLPRGAAVTGALSATYLGAFGISHPLAKKLGAWPSVLVMAGAAASITGVTLAAVDAGK
ncbi:hypothetical protein [Gordonia sp. (in: high G+C Gram-positive bacteria)]|uniref:hypothetical protein n=1 Tax=Gordonia sp. (in: high G+C Gram-positive bacteria) TaxID=84139 RepID=UPI003C70D036